MNVFSLWWHFLWPSLQLVCIRTYFGILSTFTILFSHAHSATICFLSHPMLAVRDARVLFLVTRSKTSLANLVLNTTSRKTGRCFRITMWHTILMPLILREMEVVLRSNRYCCFSHCVYATPIYIINES